MKYLHLKACLIPLLCFPLVALSFEQERVDNAALKLISAHAQIIFELDKTKFKPVSEFSRTIIDEIYKVHNLALEESSNLKFFVYDHESMLPDSAVSQKRILFEKRLSTVMYVLSKDPKNKEEFILLSPGLHKLIEQAKPHIKFTTLTVVDLLTMHEQRSNFLKKLPQTPAKFKLCLRVIVFCGKNFNNMYSAPSIFRCYF